MKMTKDKTKKEDRRQGDKDREINERDKETKQRTKLDPKLAPGI